MNAFKLTQQSHSECDCDTLLKKLILIRIFLIGNDFPLLLTTGIEEQQKRKKHKLAYLTTLILNCKHGTYHELLR